jgi:hypothetical protein
VSFNKFIARFSELVCLRPDSTKRKGPALFADPASVMYPQAALADADGQLQQLLIRLPSLARRQDSARLI